MRKIFTLCFLLALVCVKGWGQTTTVPFTTTGASTWTCPAGVYTVTVECWGGGGAGGGATGNPSAGGGGGGGSYVKNTTVTVVPGTTYNIFVGAGGTGSSTTSNPGSYGKDSWFGSTTTLLAKGGNPGSSASTNGSTASGAAALTTGNVGATSPFSYYGGAGGTGGGGGASGGGGGSSAGTGSNGNNASGTNGGGAPVGGGAGVNGSSSSANGASNTNLGGGGAGGHAGNGADRNGGNGGNGQVKITYTPDGTYKETLGPATIGSAAWCAGETRNVSITVTNTGTASWVDIPGVKDINIGVKWDNEVDYIIRTDAQGLAAGDTKTYSFTVTAPSSLATNHLTFDVVYEGVSWFGDNGGGTGPGNSKYTSTALAISQPLTALNYTNSSPVYCTNNAIATNSATATGGTATSYTVSPALPSGLNLNASTGAITGTPTTATPATDYTITASNACGSITKTLNITIVTNLSGLTYTTPISTYCVGAAIAPNTVATITGGGTITYSISPALPAGLNINPNTGTISGTPTATKAQTNYIVSASNGCSVASKEISITVVNQVTSLIYSAPTATYCTGNTITNNTPTATSGSGTLTYSISPGLPSGLSLNTSTGIISGSPNSTSPATNYTIITTNGCSNTQATVNITVIAGVSGLNYTTTSATYCTTVPVSTNTPTVTGGGTITYSVSPTLPAGLTLNSNGTITGTPTTVTASNTYRVTASNGCSSSFVDLTLAVVAKVASLSYTVTSPTYCTNNAIATNSPTVTANSGTINYSVNPALPAGLTLNSNGTITGTPTTATALATYTVTASNGCSSAQANLNITVITGVSGLNYTTTSTTYCTTVPIATNTPTVTGGGTIVYSVSPALPAGLTLNSNGTITGTPTTVTASKAYRVTASNGCSSAFIDLTIAVVAKVTSLTYTVTSPTYCTNNAIATNSPTVTANSGTITYSVTPTLPGGLTLNSNGTITGTPTTATALATYTVTASNGCSSAQANLNITVITGVSGLAYSATTASYCSGNTITPLTVTNIVGGGTITYSVSPALPAGLTLNAGTGEITGTPTTASAVTNYTVTASNGCSSDNEIISITVNASPTAVSVAPTTAAICSGDNTTLTASATTAATTVFVDNFDGTPLFVSAGSASGDASQIWSQETSGTNVNNVGTFTSPQGGKLMIALSASANGFGTFGTTTTSTLTSPVIVTNNYSSLTLTYQHTYKKGTSTSAATVEISTDGGSNWSVLQTYNTTNQGTNTSFVTGTLNLSNTYLNQTNLKIRFNFNSSNAATFGNVSSWWAIDNVALNGVPLPLFSWTASPSGATAGFPNNNVGTPSVANKAIIVSPTVTTTYTLTAQNPANSCSAATTATSTVTVNPATVITVQPSPNTQTQCEGTPISFSVGATGTNLSYQWYTTTSPNPVPASDTKLGTGSTLNTTVLNGINYYYVVITGNCGTVTSNLVTVLSAIRINTQPVASATYCPGDTPDYLSVSASGTGLTYQWYSNTSATNSGGTLISGATAPSYLPSTATPGTYYYYVVIKAPACTNTKASEAATIIVNPPTAVTGQPSTAPQTVCQNTPATQLSVTAAGADLHYQWYSNASATNSGGTAVGTDAPTYTPSTTAPGTLYYYVVVTGSCAPTPVPSAVSGGVTVNPLPTATISGTTAVCQNDAQPTVTFTGGNGTSPYTFTYTVNGGSAQTITTISGNSVTVAQPTNTAGTFTYNLISVQDNSSTQCSQTVSGQSAVITVNPQPVIANKTATAACAGTFSVMPTNGTDIVPAGTTYSWGAPSGTGFTGGATGTNQTSISGTLTNTTNGAVTAVYTVTPKSGNNCIGNSFTVTVTVSPVPSIANKTTTAACNGTFSLTPSNGGGDIVPTGTTYSWSAPTGTGFSGGSAGSGTSISGTLTNTTAATVTATYTVTATSGSCTSNFTVSVSVLPIPSIASQTTITCSGSAFTVIPATGGGNSVPAGTTYSWSVPTMNAGISGGAAGSGSSITGTLTNSGTSAGTATYTVTPTSANGCVGNNFTVTVTVNTTPTASISAATPSSACAGTTVQVTITATAGSSVTYTTNGSNAQTIDPFPPSGSYQFNSSPDAGSYTYAITDVHSSSCTGTPGNTATVTIYANPSPTIAGNNYIQIGGPILTLTGSGGGAWSANNSNLTLGTASGNTIPATAAQIGTTNVSYTVNEGHGAFTCTGTATKLVNVTAQFVTRVNGNFSQFSTWDIYDQNGAQASTSPIPATGNSVDVQNALTLDADYTSGGYFVITGTGSMDIQPGKIFNPGGGTIDFGSHPVTVRSTATGTGAIGQAIPPIANADNVTVERYTDGGNATDGRRAWRLMTSPISGQNIREAWQENGATNTGYGALITGESLDASTAAAQGYDYIAGSANNTSIKHYASGAWVPLSSDGNTNGTHISVRNEQAYMVFVRGVRTVQASGSSPANLRATGSLLQGNQTLSVASGTYTVVGNPYASSIDFSSVFSNPANNGVIKDQFYLWNSKYSTFGAYVLVTHDGTNGGYKATPAVITSDPTDNDAYRYIPSGSGFMVSRPTGATTSALLTIREQDKAPGNQPPVNPLRVVTNATDLRQLMVNLNQKNSDGSTNLADGFRAKFSPDYAGNEEDNSSLKPSNFSENLGLLKSGITHIVEAHNEVKKTDTLQLKMWNVSYRNYELQMKGDNFATAPDIKAWLVDSYKGTKQEVSLSGSITTVSFDVNKDSGSWKSTRFMIVFENTATALPVTITKVNAQPKNGGTEVSWTVTNEVNVKSYTVERKGEGGQYTAVGTQQAAKNNPQAALTSYSGYDAMPKLGDNYYRIRIEGKDGSISYSSVVKVTIGTGGSGIQITLYPNPVREGKANLTLTNLKEGTYLVSVFSGSGQTVYQKKVTVTLSGTSQTEQLLLGNNLAQGAYQIRVADHTGNILYTDKLIIGR